ncbi:LCP family protein [Streptomyces sp. NBC_01180]|nr:LCP family protein [Streptomyces sp. NBC_01180]
MPPPRRRRPPPRRPPRPRWGMRITTTLSVLVLGAGGIGHALIGELDGIGRIDPFKDMKDRPAPGRGMNVLLVGTDGRDKITPAEKKKYHLGGAPCHCTDTVMLVHVSADRSRVSVVSLPRDSYAVVPARTDSASGRRYPAHPLRLNAAYAQGGPQLTVATVEKMTGVQINHYLEVDFTSFMKTVDVLGGVDICSARPLKDSYTGLDLPVGTSRLNGGQALQYVRSRHLDAASDLGRMQRQQRFMASLIAKTTSSGVLLNPVKFRDVASTIFGSVRADKGFGPDEMLSIGQAMRGFEPASSEFTSVPIGQMNYQVKGIGSTVKWDPVKAGKLFREIRADVPIAVHRSAAPKARKVDVPPNQIRVQVSNGTSTTGLAARADKSLRSTGFLSSVAATVPGGPVTSDSKRTVIEYDPRWNRSVRSLAAALPHAELRPVAGIGSTLKVTLGSDFTTVTPVRADEPDPGRFAAVTGDQVVCK